MWTEMFFLVLAGTAGSTAETNLLEDFAVYIGNLFFLTSDAAAPIVRDKDLTPELAGTLNEDILHDVAMKPKQAPHGSRCGFFAGEHNLIVIGSSDQNAITSQYIQRVDIEASNSGVLTFLPMMQCG